MVTVWPMRSKVCRVLCWARMLDLPRHAAVMQYFRPLPVLNVSRRLCKCHAIMDGGCRASHLAEFLYACCPHNVTAEMLRGPKPQTWNRLPLRVQSRLHSSQRTYACSTSKEAFRAFLKMFSSSTLNPIAMLIQS